MGTHQESDSAQVSAWLWRATIGILVFVVIAGLAAALWLGTRPVGTGSLVPVGDWGAWTLGPGASGNEKDRGFVLRADATFNRVVYATNETALSDFALEVRARSLSGPDDAGYGMVVRYRAPDEYVTLLIGADGYIAVGQVSGGVWRWRVPWQQWPHIRRGAAENLLRAECRADRCRFFVNDEFAFEVDGVPIEGQIGPAIWKPAQADSVTAEFREWRVWSR